MIRFHKITASVSGIGYLKGGGTYAALLTAVAWYGMQQYMSAPPVFLQLIVTVMITALGIWNGNMVEKDWGKDSCRVVIDEVAGMCITLVGIPLTIPYMIAGLCLFRFFDIAKPLYIRRMEKLPGGWGVMGDDVLAGVYANLLLQIVVYGKWW